MEQEFSITETGDVHQDKAPVTRVSGVRNILAAVSDPNVSVGEGSRLITIEIASIACLIAELLDDPTNTVKVRTLNDQAKMLRELQKSLMESDTLSKKDTLNFDGPKFQFVLVQLFGFFKKALKESGVEESLANNIQKQFSDIVKVNDDKLRRETAHIVSGA